MCSKSGASRYHLMPCVNADCLHCKAQQPRTKNTLQEPWLTAWSNKIAGDFIPWVISWRNTEINSIVSLIPLIIKSFVTHLLALNWEKKGIYIWRNASCNIWQLLGYFVLHWLLESSCIMAFHRARSESLHMHLKISWWHLLLLSCTS